MKRRFVKIKKALMIPIESERGITLIVKFFAMALSLSLLFYMMVVIGHQLKIVIWDYIEMFGIPVICLWAYLECLYPGGYHWRSPEEKKFEEQRQIISSLLDRIVELVEVNEAYQQLVDKIKAEQRAAKE